MNQLNPDGPVIVSSSLALVLFGGVWLLFAVPFGRGLFEGLRAGDWWSPFARNAQGRHGILARSRFLASFRAPEPERRTRAGLIGRWAVWAFVVVVLGAYALQFAVRLIEVAVN
ncbi:MAG: hypothetical protein ABIW49_12250 [Knoellia sp.]